MFRNAVVPSCFSVFAILVANYAPSQATSLDVIGKDLTLAQCQTILATGDCNDVGPEQSCGTEEYCAENGCSGLPYIPPGQSVGFVKDCVTVNQHNITKLRDWYYLYQTGTESGPTIETMEGQCIRKCNCSTYCTDHDEGPGTNYLCDSTTTCVNTGNFIDPVHWYLPNCYTE